MGINKQSLKTRSVTIIPCCNEEVTIDSIAIKAKRFVNTIVIIDDASIDDTIKIEQNAEAVLIISAIVMFIGLMLIVNPDVIKSSKEKKNMEIFTSYLQITF